MTAGIPVTLDISEVQTAANIGARRQVQNLAARRQEAHGRKQGDAWTPHIEGACGEMAVAKHFGLYWSGALGRLRAGDVGKLQVRTRTEHWHELILHDNDDPDAAFILVTGIAPDFVLVGWIMGRDGMRRDFWKDPAGGRPAYFVPQEHLRPFQELTGALK